MPIDLYYVPGSAPCRGVQLAAALVGVELNLKHTDLMKGEHMTPEFIKMNPQHTVPTIDDNGFYLHESRAIITYLFNKYGKEDSQYPKDAEKRAIVDQRLYFDMGTLYQRFGDYFYPTIFGGQPADPEKLKKLEEALGYFDKMLEGSEYAAGSSITLADASLAASISTIDVVGIVDLSKYQNITSWFNKCKAALPDYEEANNKGALAFKALTDHLSKKA
ncbi:unnamed protein product [Bemisia tabaci]|uniref:Glutathione S-transferase 1-like protein n=2 Tax=Bemisia tabaci TaxID=7038 RepID=A0A7S5HG02_BEMTA|nr:glutathione S-transferase 1-like protein [Bemisia tabaci]CAH0393337.1 unnamed protein product [Bemisia tabaci]